ncbi:MAG: hypothetical protein AB2693_29615 [Candidatus Thiodiazotropha sp.]
MVKNNNMFLSLDIVTAMYQNELTPEVDKVNKTINQSVSRSSSQTDLPPMAANSTVTGTQSTESVVMATTHADDLPHPSEVLIDLKVYTCTSNYYFLLLIFFLIFWDLNAITDSQKT